MSDLGSTLVRGLSARHIRFIALGSAIGTGLFYGAVSLWQLATADGGQGATRIAAQRIEDAPAGRRIDGHRCDEHAQGTARRVPRGCAGRLRKVTQAN